MDSQIKNIWMKLHSIVKCGSKVYLVLAENQISEFRYKFKTLRFTAEEAKIYQIRRHKYVSKVDVICRHYFIVALHNRLR